MGLLGSTLGRAISGAAQSGADYFTKYIDNDLQMQKAAALADLQRTTANKIREDDDAFKNDPNRIARDRSNKVADITATGDATNAVALKGKKAEASDTELTAAQVERENAIVKGTTQAKVDARNAELNGTMGAEAKRAGLMARAQDVGGGLRAAQTAILNMDLKDKQRLGTLYDQYTAITNDPNLPEADKAAKLKPVSNAIQALKAKNGQVAQRDPELDTQTVVEEKMNPDGTTTKTTRKEVRKAGGIGAPEAPYPDGTELKGKDGKSYIVQGGKPVEKGAKSLMDSAAKPRPSPPPRPMDQNESVLAEAAKRREEALAKQSAEARAQAGRDAVLRINSGKPLELQLGD